MNMTPSRYLLFSAALVMSPACGSLDAPPDGSGEGGEVLVSRTAGDLTITDVNASDLEAWIYLDFESTARVQPANANDSGDWDIAFQRFKAKVNGGSSGTGGVEVAVLEGVDFDGLTEAPATGYRTDRADGDDDGEIEDYAISVGPSSETGPWAYDEINHTLSQSNYVFVVRSVEGNYYKLRFTRYYSDVGDAGFITVEWATLGGQTTDEDIVSIALADRGFTYVSLRTKAVVDVTTPETDAGWDVAIQAAAWSTNSGPGRAGQGGARLAPEGVDFDAVQTATTAGYVVDEMIPYPAAPGAANFLGNSVLTEWFDYDAVLHKADPRDIVFLVRTADGDYAKLKILSYDDSSSPFTYEVKVETVPAASE